MRRLVGALRAAVWFTIVGCTLGFLWQLFVSFTYFWLNADFNQHLDLHGAYAKQVQNAPFEQMITYAFSVKIIIFNWLLLLVIALLSIWLKNWPFSNDQQGESEEPIQATGRGHLFSTKWSYWKHQASMLFQYQLWPRKFWAWALEGGFSVTDLIVVVLWILLQIAVIYLAADYYWDYYAEDYASSGVWYYGDITATRYEVAGLAGAWICVENLTLLFLPVPRNSFLMYLFNTDFSVLIKYHRWLGHATLWSVALHGIPFYAQWIHQHTFWSNLVAWQYSGINYLAGSLSFLFGIILWVTTLPLIRRRYFNVFYWSHIFGFLGFTLFMVIHYTGCIWYIPGAVLYFMDLTFRLSQWGVTSGMHCTFVAADNSFATLRVTFNKAAKVKPAQFLFLNVPSVSRFAWHPVSVAAVEPNADGLTDAVSLHVKVYGKWTKAVIAQIHEHGQVRVRADGPYGASIDRPEWTSFDTLILIAGGIGITPILGMLREITDLQLSQSDSDSSYSCRRAWKVPSSVHLIWAVRNREELKLLDPDLLAAASAPGSWLKLSLFHTGKKDAFEADSEGANGMLKTIPPALLADSNGIPSDAAIKESLRHLQPYGFGDAHWALAHLLAMLGAFFACMMAQAYAAEGYFTSELGSPYWLQGTVTTIAFVVGSMGLPALIIFPLFMYRYRKHVRACEAVHNRFLAQASINGNHAEDSTPQKAILHTLPPRNMGNALDLENGRGVSIAAGRPDLDQLLASIVSEHPGNRSMGVIASGPPSLVESSRTACQAAGPLAKKLGLRGIPELSFSAHSFEL